MAQPAASVASSVATLLKNVPPQFKVPNVSQLLPIISSHGSASSSSIAVTRIVALNPHAMTLGGSNTYLLGAVGVDRENNKEGTQEEGAKDYEQHADVAAAGLPLAADALSSLSLIHGGGEKVDAITTAKRMKTSPSSLLMLVDSGEGKPLYPTVINYAMSKQLAERSDGNVKSTTTTTAGAANSASAPSSFSSSSSFQPFSSPPLVGSIFLTHWHGDHVGGVADVLMDVPNTLMMNKAMTMVNNNNTTATAAAAGVAAVGGGGGECGGDGCVLTVPFGLFKMDGAVMPNKTLHSLLSDQLALKIQKRLTLIKTILRGTHSDIESDTTAKKSSAVVLFDLRKSMTASSASSVLFSFSEEDLWQFASKHHFFGPSLFCAKVFDEDKVPNTNNDNTNSCIEFEDGLPLYLLSSSSSLSPQIMIPLSVESLRREERYLSTLVVPPIIDPSDLSFHVGCSKPPRGERNQYTLFTEQRRQQPSPPSTTTVNALSIGLDGNYSGSGGFPLPIIYKRTKTATKEEEGGGAITATTTAASETQGTVRELGLFLFGGGDIVGHRQFSDSLSSTEAPPPLASVLTAPGHTDDHTLLFLHRDKALITADTVLGSFTTAVASSSSTSTSPPPAPVTTAFTCYSDYMTTLEGISNSSNDSGNNNATERTMITTAATEDNKNNDDTAAASRPLPHPHQQVPMQVDFIFPGHGTVVHEKAEKRVDFYIAHRLKREAQVLAMLEEWRGFEEEEDKGEEEGGGADQQSDQKEEKEKEEAIDKQSKKTRRPTQSPSLSVAVGDAKSSSSPPPSPSSSSSPPLIPSYPPTCAASLVDAIYKGVIPAGSNLVTAAQNNVLHILRKLQLQGKIALVGAGEGEMNSDDGAAVVIENEAEGKKKNGDEEENAATSRSDGEKREEDGEETEGQQQQEEEEEPENALPNAFLAEEAYPRQLYVLPAVEQPSSVEARMKETYSILGGSGESPPPMAEQPPQQQASSSGGIEQNHRQRWRPNAQRYSTELIWKII